MTDIDLLIKKIIPTDNYQYRNGFSNEHIILSLSDFEKKAVEERLLILIEKNDDTLIGETLILLKSSSALPYFYKKLESSSNPVSTIIWASYINDLKEGDKEMKDISLKAFKKINDKYSLISIFHILSQFRDKNINDFIYRYIDNKDYLIAYNARAALGINTDGLIIRERTMKSEVRGNRWWYFWKQ